MYKRCKNIICLNKITLLSVFFCIPMVRGERLENYI
jgi:hypothetical protein